MSDEDLAKRGIDKTRVAVHACGGSCPATLNSSEQPIVVIEALNKSLHAAAR